MLKSERVLSSEGMQRDCSAIVYRQKFEQSMTPFVVIRDEKETGGGSLLGNTGRYIKRLTGMVHECPC